MKNDKKKLRK